MSLKKIMSSLVILAIFIMFIIVPKETYAEQLPAGQKVYMGIQKLMSSNDPKMGYGINQPGLNNGAYIWNIVKYDSATASTYTQDNIYCVKAGVGFTTSSGAERREPYDVFYNMKTERNKIKAQNAILSGLVDGTVTGVSRYNAILAILDRLYLPGESTENEKRQLVYNLVNCAMTDNDYLAYRDYVDLLEQAFNLPAGKDIVDLILENSPTKYALTEYALTDNDIKAVQQAVLWYFTNSEESAKYDKTSNQNWLHYTLNGNDYSHTLNEYTSGGKQVGLARNVQAEILYNYMIRQAKANANNYANSSANAGAPAQVDTKTLNGDLSGNNYVIGPIHMTQLNSTPYTIDFKVKNNGTEITNYQLLDENKRAVSAGTTVQNLVGKDFYISVPKSQVDSLTIDIKVNYNETTMTLWASSTNNQEQPLVEIHKGEHSVSAELRFTPKKKVFDLALRKYITKVERGDEEISVVSRVPNIDESSLATGTTATYKHKKDPVVIKTGDKVTYKLTIYNEGEKAGRATKVVDQLPTGLEFSKVVSGNFEKESYNKTTNTLNLIRKAGNQTNLPAYATGKLTSGTGTETIEIECIVTATPDTKNDKVLTNVAWISEEFDAEDNVTITNQTGADRDSEPVTKPNVNKDNMSNYTGRENKTDLTDANYYYKGQQDDDDFEKLILLPEKLEFDLALRKYITKIERGDEEIPVVSRVPNIDESSLATGTTATYKHKKDPVVIETGDKVTYKLTIYNEGEKAGRATKVVDQLPTGLEFSKVISGNFEEESYNKTTNTLNLIRKAGNEANLPAYTTGNLTSGTGTETIEIECIVTATPDTKNDKVLTNVAWILEEFDAEDNVTITNQTGADRDSEPVTKPDVNKDNMSDYTGKDNKTDLTDSNYYYKGQQDDDDFEKLILLPEKLEFDLALRKYITKVERGDEEIPVVSRIPNIDESSLATGTTATYKHKKDPVVIKTGDKVTYKLTIYNEGEKAGRATKVVDQLPTGLEFSKVISGNFEEESYNKTTNTLNLIRKAGNETNLPAYTTGNLTSGTGAETIEIECIVTATPDTENDKVLTNVAWISEEFDAEDNVTITNQTGADRDSEPATKPDVNKDNMSDYTGKDNKTDLTDSNYYYKGQQDDDDFEKLILIAEKPEFDLKLIKRITEVNGKEVPERIQSIDVSKLNTSDDDRKTTADYQLNKEPVGVAKGDIVTYALRIYNEGMIDGYAQEITEDVPEGLQFLWSEKEGEELKADKTLTEDEKNAIEFNQKYLWGKFVYDDKKERITQISTNYLDMYGGSPAPTDGPDDRVLVTDNLIKAFGHNDGTKTEKDLDYKEIYVKFKVVSENIAGTPIRNEAAITEDTDENGNTVDDRDSHTDEWHEHPDHEDDEDHDYIILQSFDLALRKFIIAVSNDTKIENNEYLKNEDGSYTRAPVVDTSELNTEDETGKLITTAKYNHTKEPVIVSPNAIVVYMLRVYNEGDADGYASEIKDHLPPYLEYVDDEFNKQYGWEVSEDGRTVTTRYLAQDKFLIHKATTDANGKIQLSYKEVPIMCKVKENAKTSENITNIADITEYLDKNKQPVVDRDSQENNVKLPEDKDLPGYKEDEKGSYVPGQQDDDDFEKVVIKIFDLALRKWVTQAIVIENGQQKVTQTGHDAWDEPEAVVKVELHKKKLDQVTVKFRYSIRVYNQGEIEGYAKEVTDYIPEGLKFIAEDNKGWKDEGNNVISTRLLENTLLQPGEYADVEVILTWINNENNMGVMNNIAEISEDYNKYGVPDIDSTPDNKKEGEDDIDDAPVMLSISTGQIRIYFTLGFIILITTASGIILIKKFVL